MLDWKKLSMITNLRSYRLAKKLKKDSESFLRVIDLSIRGLKPFVVYVPIKKILHELEEQKGILQSHLNTAEKILSKKEVISEK